MLFLIFIEMVLYCIGILSERGLGCAVILTIWVGLCSISPILGILAIVVPIIIFFILVFKDSIKQRLDAICNLQFKKMICSPTGIIVIAKSILIIALAILLTRHLVIFTCYRSALEEIVTENFEAGQNYLRFVPDNYRDSKKIKIYFDYAEYVKSEDVLDEMPEECMILMDGLQYDKTYQYAIDRLLIKLEKQVRVTPHNDELPCNGMRVCDLAKTSLGRPDYSTQEHSFNTYTTYVWLTKNNYKLAECMVSSFGNPTGDEEIFGFEYYGQEYGYDSYGNYIGEE